MDCVNAREQLSSYLDGELDSALVNDLELHLCRCVDCQCELNEFKTLGGLCCECCIPQPPNELWGNIDRVLSRSVPLETITPLRRSDPSRRVWTLALSVVLLLAASVWQSGFWRGHRHGPDDPMVVNLQALLSQFASDPLVAMNALSAQYQGQEVSLDTAASMLGYRPAIGDRLPAGYQLTSTRILKMPCCLCSASVCTRADGSAFVVFEHSAEQQISFGDAPRISVKCSGTECRLVQMSDEIAITWKSGNRQLTAVGINGLEEAASLIAAVEVPSSAG